MSKNKGTDYFYFKPFRSGSVSFPRPNEAIYVIDVLSRDDIVYFDDFGYLISERALEVLKKHNLTGVKVDNATVKFSAKHNIRYKNQTLPKFYRLIPTEIVDNELREMFLDENYNLEKILVLVSYMTYSIVTRKPQTECYYVEIQDLEHGENLYKGWYLNTVLMNSIVRLLWKKQRRLMCSTRHLGK